MREAVHRWAVKHLPEGVYLSHDAVNDLIEALGLAQVLKVPLENIFHEKRD